MENYITRTWKENLWCVQSQIPTDVETNKRDKTSETILRIQTEEIN